MQQQRKFGAISINEKRFFPEGKRDTRKKVFNYIYLEYTFISARTHIDGWLPIVIGSILSGKFAWPLLVRLVFSHSSGFLVAVSKRWNVSGRTQIQSLNQTISSNFSVVVSNH